MDSSGLVTAKFGFFLSITFSPLLVIKKKKLGPIRGLYLATRQDELSVGVQSKLVVDTAKFKALN